MDGKTRGGKRLAKKETRPLPVGWAVVALVAVALIFTGWLFAEGRNEAQKAAQGGPGRPPGWGWGPGDKLDP